MMYANLAGERSTPHPGATARRCPNCRATILTGIDFEFHFKIPAREAGR